MSRADWERSADAQSRARLRASAALDTLRADTSQATNDLAELAIERAAKLESAYPALDEAQAAAERQGTAQSARIDALAAALR